MVDQTAQSLFAEDLAFRRGFRHVLYFHRLQRRIFLGLMRAFRVIKSRELGNDVVQMRLAEEHKMIEALDLKGLHPTFGECVYLRHRLHLIRTMALECFVLFTRFIRGTASNLPS